MDEDENPFLEVLSGGSPRTAISASETFSGATTVPENPNGQAISWSDPVTKSFYEMPKGMWGLFGDAPSSEATAKSALNAPCSVTRERYSRPSLSDRLTLSLITAGLVLGITPSLTRKQSNQPIQVLALDTPDGNDAGRPPEGY